MVGGTAGENINLNISLVGINATGNSIWESVERNSVLWDVTGFS